MSGVWERAGGSGGEQLPSERQAWAIAGESLLLRQEAQCWGRVQDWWQWVGSEWPWAMEHQSAPRLCRQLLSYITKDKQTESLVEKLCQRFRTARYAAFLEGSLC